MSPSLARSLTAAVAAAALLAAPRAAAAQDAAAPVTSPRAFFGHEIGADYVLPNYTQLHRYFERVTAESPRVVLDTIGVTEEGRPQIMAIVTSPANHAQLDRYKTISQRLALARGVDSAEARALAREGKAVVWIDGGLHATEVLGAQQLIETFWQLASSDDEEIRRFLDDCIILLAHANPDGMELVSDWYMREADSLARSTGNLPRLYEKYAGHDNNRDSYMNALAESEHISRVLYREWHPIIMYNHHQTGPAGAVMFAPPFRDPANYNIPAGVLTGIDVVGAAIHDRFVSEGKGGTVSRRAANYSTWWNGGLRTTAYFHNMIGLLTETIGHPTPMRVPVVPSRQLRATNQPLPVEPGPWHFRQSVDYSVTANWAVLDVASRNREKFLYNRWRMGAEQIAAGSQDSWTTWPRRIARLADSLDALQEAGQLRRIGRGASPEYMALLRRPEDRDPRAYVLPSDQPDFPTAVKFAQALQKSGVAVQRATQPFSANGHDYPAGSLVVQTAQAFRAHVLDMFEPQDHPDDFRFPGGPPIPPYDNAGWTLALQMGVDFDRHLDAVTGPFATVDDVMPMPAGTVADAEAGWLVHAAVNDGITVANRLSARDLPVFRTTSAFRDDGRDWPAGTWFVPAGPEAAEVVRTAARELGVSFAAAIARPPSAQRVRPLRVALYDRYGGMMPAGWTRLVLEQFEVPHTVVYPRDLDAGDLRENYDVLVLVNGAISTRGRRGYGGTPDTTLVPAEYRRMLGTITEARTVPRLREFLDAGGRIVAIGSSTALAGMLDLPVSDHLVDESGERLPPEEYYIPGSLLAVGLDTSATIAAGLPARPTVMYERSPVLRLGEGAAAAGVRAIATYDRDESLRSGWAWGQQYLKGGVAIAEASVGQGTLWLFGPEVLFRAQPHGTFKLFFNTLLGGFDRAGTADADAAAR